MGFETDLEGSDSWNPLQQTLLDVADLDVKKLGKLECRPVLEGTQVIYVPPEVDSNRIGYLGVQISNSFREATLLGFVKKVSKDGATIMEATARSANSHIQLQLSGLHGEHFSVKMVLGDVKVIENFVI